MESFMQDLRYAVRQLSKNPGFTAVAVITLALGVGANAAIYSIANWLVLRPVPGVRAPSQLAVVQLWYTEAERSNHLSLSYPQFFDFAARAKSFEGVTMVGYGAGSAVIRLGDEDPIASELRNVGHRYFDVLGVRLAAGRGFTREEELEATAAPVAVMSYRIWSTRFSRDSGVVGRLLELNGIPVRIVGVAAPGFEGDELGARTDFWVPPFAGQAIARSPMNRPLNDPRNTLVREIIVRRAPGVSVAAASAEAATLLPQVMKDNPRPDAGPEVTFTGRYYEGIGMPVVMREVANRSVRILLGTSVLLVLIACANLANLLLFRASGRREELAVRRALGADRWRVIRQQLTEGGVLSLVSGVIAIVLSFWFVRILRGPFLFRMEISDAVRPDLRVLTVALLASLVVGLIATLAPMVGREPDMITGLKQGSGRTTTGRAYLRGGLAVIQLAVSLTLLVGAFLLVRTLRNLRRVDVGFDPRHLTGFVVDLRRAGYNPEGSAIAAAEIQRRLQESAGIQAVTTAMHSPFSRISFTERVRRTGAADETPVQVTSNPVAPEYFETLQIPLKAGRTFTGDEVSAARYAGSQSQGEITVVVNELLANQLFGSPAAALDQLIGAVYRSGPGGRPYRIVGVAQDTRWMGFAEEIGPFMYRPNGSLGTSLEPLFLVRAPGPALEVEATIRAVLRAVNPTLMPVVLASLTERLEEGIAQQRVFGKVLVTLSVLAVLLASVGLYGLIAFSVTERTREFGIRLALGAEGARLVRMVLRQGAVLALIGIPLGLAGAFGLSRLLSNRLFGVRPVEPVLYGLAAVFLVLIALAACLLPARAASRIDPMIALRSE